MLEAARPPNATCPAAQGVLVELEVAQNYAVANALLVKADVDDEYGEYWIDGRFGDKDRADVIEKEKEKVRASVKSDVQCCVEIGAT